MAKASKAPQKAVYRSRAWKAKIGAVLRSKRQAGWRARKMATCHPERPAKAHGLCQPCYRRAYYQQVENRQLEIDRARRWQIEHPDEFHAAQRRWRQTHPGADSQTSRQGRERRNPLPVPEIEEAPWLVRVADLKRRRKRKDR